MRILLWRKNRSKSLLLSPGLRLYSQVVMFIHASKFACLNLPTCLVCPASRQKATKQNSCRWQYKMSLYQRLLTITSDLRACPIAFLLFYHGWDGKNGYWSCEAIRQQPNKPLALDARCLLRAIDVAAARKSLSKLRYFQPAPPSPFRVLASIARR